MTGRSAHPPLARSPLAGASRGLRWVCTACIVLMTFVHSACREAALEPPPWREVSPLDWVGSGITLEARDGRRVAPRSGRVTILHLWATWCRPCREELPRLLDYARTHPDVEVFAITDEPWPEVSRYFGGAIPEAIHRDPAGRLGRWLGTDVLPESYLVDVRGEVFARTVGPRPWSGSEPLPLGRR